LRREEVDKGRKLIKREEVDGGGMKLRREEVVEVFYPALNPYSAFGISI
jgi:hypothetical protein